MKPNNSLQALLTSLTVLISLWFIFTFDSTWQQVSDSISGRRPSAPSPGAAISPILDDGSGVEYAIYHSGLGHAPDLIRDMVSSAPAERTAGSERYDSCDGLSECAGKGSAATAMQRPKDQRSRKVPTWYLIMALRDQANRRGELQKEAASGMKLSPERRKALMEYLAKTEVNKKIAEIISDDER